MGNNSLCGVIVVIKPKFFKRPWGRRPNTNPRGENPKDPRLASLAANKNSGIPSVFWVVQFVFNIVFKVWWNLSKAP